MPDEYPIIESISSGDCEYRNLVVDACARIQPTLSRRAPFLGKEVCRWMSQLSPTGKPSDYFLQARAFPLLRLPWWAARSCAVAPDPDFLVDVLYSTMNGYYYIRLIDNLMDGHATCELKLLPATAFFHTEFQAIYQRYFGAGHPFWELFRSAWFAGNEAVTREMNLDHIEREDFETVTVGKLAAAVIPIAAVLFRCERSERLPHWERFTRGLARWSQMEDDLFDWHRDLSHNKVSYFLTQVERQRGSDSPTNWIIREGFQRGLEALRSELHALRELTANLNCPEIVVYLDARQSLLDHDKARTHEAFQLIRDLASLTEIP